MSRKLPGSAIVPGTITVAQITGGLNDTTNASYAQANTARTTANDAYGQANTAREQANTARTQANTAYGQANNAYSSANLSYDQANASYNVANTKLASAGGTLSGDLIITGNLTVSGNSTTLNTEVLTVEDAEVVLLSNVASTPALNAGVIVNRGTSPNTFLRWDEALDEWGWSDNGTTTYYFEDLRAGLATTNTTFGTVNTSLGTINTSYQAAYAQANTAHGTANDAYGQANTARTQANTAYGQANSAYGQANTARTQANTAYGQANAAYGAANNTVLKAGDTMTGQLNISSGGLLVTGNVGIGTSSPAGKLDIGSGDLNFSSTAQRIRGDFSNATAANRLMIQSNVTNGTTTFGIMPNGTGTVANFAAFGNAANTANSSVMFIGVSNNGTEVRFNSTISGTGTYLPMTFNTGGSERARIDTSGNLGLGVTPSAWATYTAAQVQQLSLASYTNGDGRLNNNCFYDSGGNWKYINTRYAVQYLLDAANGIHAWYTAPSGTAGNTVTFTQAMTLDASGNLAIGQTSASSRLDLQAASGETKIILRTVGNTADSSNYIAAETGGFTGDWANLGVGARHAIKFYNNGTERMRLDSSGNLGLGVTPSAWGSIFNAMQLGDGGFIAGRSDVFTQLQLGCNGYYDGSNFKFLGTGRAARYYQDSGEHYWETSASGTAGNTISFTTAMTLNASGNLGIGTTSPAGKLHVYGGDAVLYSGSAGNSPKLIFGGEYSTTDKSIYLESYFLVFKGHNNEGFKFITANAGGTQSERLRIGGDGTIRPGADNAQDLGSSSYRWANIYTADLNLSNRDSQNDVDGTWGDWTIQEGEKDLYLINRRNGKKYSFVLKEIL